VGAKIAIVQSGSAPRQSTSSWTPGSAPPSNVSDQARHGETDEIVLAARFGKLCPAAPKNLLRRLSRHPV
jgi:hypothetical protein